MDIRKKLSKYVSFALSTALLSGVPVTSEINSINYSVAYAAWDGYINNETSEYISVVNFDSHEDIASTNALPSRKMAGDGLNYSIHWNEHLDVKDIYLRKFPSMQIWED